MTNEWLKLKKNRRSNTNKPQGQQTPTQRWNGMYPLNPIKNLTKHQMSKRKRAKQNKNKNETKDTPESHSIRKLAVTAHNNRCCRPLATETCHNQSPRLRPHQLKILFWKPAPRITRQNAQKTLVWKGRAGISVSITISTPCTVYLRVEPYQFPVILYTAVQSSFVDHEFHDERQIARPPHKSSFF